MRSGQFSCMCCGDALILDSTVVGEQMVVGDGGVEGDAWPPTMDTTGMLHLQAIVAVHSLYTAL